MITNLNEFEIIIYAKTDSLPYKVKYYNNPTNDHIMGTFSDFLIAETGFPVKLNNQCFIQWLDTTLEDINFTLYANKVSDFLPYVIKVSSMLGIDITVNSLNSDEDTIEQYNVVSTGAYTNSIWHKSDMPQELLTIFGKDGYYEDE